MNVLVNNSLGVAGPVIGGRVTTIYLPMDSMVDLDPMEVVRLKSLGAVRDVGQPNPRTVAFVAIHGVNWGVLQPGIFQTGPVHGEYWGAQHGW